MILIPAFILSMVPSVLLYIWLRNQKKEDALYRKICKKGLLRGLFLSMLMVMVVSSFFYIFEKIISLMGANIYIIDFYHNFIVFALAEELIKYSLLRGLMKKNSYSYSWLDVVCLMMIVGTGFEISEAVFYAFSGSVGTMLARGFTAMHCGYGFIMGYFIAKSMQTGEKKYTVIGILIPFILHGIYDFFLSDSILAINYNFGFISMALAGVAVITLVIAVLTIRKSKGMSERTTPIIES